MSLDKRSPFFITKLVSATEFIMVKNVIEQGGYTKSSVQ